MRYIGSKSALLEEIDNMLSKHIDGDEEIFLDLFAGTNVVGEYFKDRYTIITNDILFFSYCISKATIENNEKLSFNGLGMNPFEYFNKKDVSKDTANYYRKNYTPYGNAKYFTEINGQKIGFIRDKIDEWYEADKLEEYEYYYLITTLVKSVPSISNTTGTYGAFLKKWDNRALKNLVLKPVDIINNSKNNKAYNMDSNKLVREISSDIVYIDTPYNSRQYASNYHVLENIAQNKKPKLKGVTKIYDWSKKRSDYSMKNKALPAMKDLIENIDAKHIILSYSNEGIITYDELVSILKENAINKEVDIVEISYDKYQSKIKSSKNKVSEYLFYIRKRENTLKKNKEKPVPISTWKPEKPKFIKSPLNYIGGKHRLLSQIIPLFPENIDTFLDLFSGGANVGINVNANKHIFNDMNNRVNEMFRYFASQDTEKLIENIKQRIKENNLTKTNKEAYLKFRDQYNTSPNPLDLYVLISFSYNYQIRFNNSLEFNNPFGNNRSSFSVNMENNLRDFNNKLKTLDYQFTDLYFEEIDFSEYGKEDFVYLDPPYLITTGNYNDGNRGFKNWTELEELKMYELLKYLNAKGVPFALSNVLEHKGTKNNMLINFIKENNLYVHELNASYRNASYNTKRLDSREVLITNYKKPS